MSLLDDALWEFHRFGIVYLIERDTGHWMALPIQEFQSRQERLSITHTQRLTVAAAIAESERIKAVLRRKN